MAEMMIYELPELKKSCSLFIEMRVIGFIVFEISTLLIKQGCLIDLKTNENGMDEIAGGGRPCAIQGLK